MVKTAGILSSALLHSVPCSLPVVLETYTEDPRTFLVKRLEGPAEEYDICFRLKNICS